MPKWGPSGGRERNAIRLHALRKSLGDLEGVPGIELGIGHGEFFSMRGPSGSGRTAVLRLVAGFETATSGTASGSRI
ncbi:hypothetical protein [Streptomyces beijiangensis]|uniref:ABC transporter domain-containing protein n=1 Tax=Streptomyces beijiangensis TaxID=163361 RepID=A0A939JGX8_9ACTN|nr:hypothetical protein [Streptomyces beijiangensis]MBO0512027.1 hypothetical protein [Streptomyces beijiangensis]